MRGVASFAAGQAGIPWVRAWQRQTIEMITVFRQLIDN